MSLSTQAIFRWHAITKLSEKEKNKIKRKMKECQTACPQGKIPNMLSFSHQSCIRIWTKQNSDEKYRIICEKLSFICVNRLGNIFLSLHQVLRILSLLILKLLLIQCGLDLSTSARRFSRRKLLRDLKISVRSSSSTICCEGCWKELFMGAVWFSNQKF